jgi:hypothetical protein
LPPSERDVEKLLAREEKKAQKRAKREAQKAAAEAWRKRWYELAEESRAAADARKRRGSVLATAEKEIDRAIEEGVTALVSALGKRAASAARTLSGEPRRDPRTDFERYVARQRGTAVPVATPALERSGPIVTPPPPRTRVEAPAEEEVEERVEEARVRARRRR